MKLSDGNLTEIFRPILILGLVWQIIRIQLLSQISLKNVPELVVLLADGEDLASFIKLPPETILLRWMNYHLARGGYPNQVNNFGGDIAVRNCVKSHFSPMFYERAKSS